MRRAAGLPVGYNPPVIGDELLLAAADHEKLGDFYKTVSSISFTLLGLWWVVVQLKYKEGAGDRARRRHA